MWMGSRLKFAVFLQVVPGMLIGTLTFFNRTVLVISDNGGVMPKFVDDLFACINPYLLWIFSDALRKYVFMTLGIGQCGSGRATAAVTIQTVGN
ncbi:unnamed protein product [Caenorhabditis brenneri]